MGITFVKLEQTEDRRIMAEVAEPQLEGSLDQEKLQQIISEQGYGDWFQNVNEINALIGRTNEGHTGRYPIMEQKDAELVVDYSPDKMEAFARVLPPAGGSPLTEQIITSAFTENSILEKALIPDIVKKLLRTKTGEQISIARGQLPKKGRNGRYEWLVEEEPEPEKPGEDEIIDYRAGQTYTVIAENTPVLRYHTATQGTDGFDVQGKPLKAENGKEIQFGKDWSGVVADPRDEYLFVSSYRGHPVNLNPGARIDQTLRFNGVNLDSGHIDYDGSIEISGDVEATMKVKVTGDVFIKGTVERASIIAGNDITITGGVLGEDIKVTDPDLDAESISYQCHLRAGGKVDCRFVNLSDIEANEIFIREYAFHSQLHAKKSVFLGEQGGKGTILGGNTSAGQIIRARNLGNPTYNLTHVQVGLTQKEKQKLKIHITKLQKRREEARQMVELLGQLKEEAQKESQPDTIIDKAHKIKATLGELRLQIAEHNAGIQSLREKASYEDMVISAQRVYPNVDVTINGANLRTNEEHKQISWIEFENELTVKLND